MLQLTIFYHVPRGVHDREPNAVHGCLLIIKTKGVEDEAG